MLPPPPRQELRARRRKCAELHHKLDTSVLRFPRVPRAVAIFCAAFSKLKSTLPTPILDSCSPDFAGSSDPRGKRCHGIRRCRHRHLPRVWTSGTHKDPIRCARTRGGCLSPLPFRPIPSKTGLVFRTSALHGCLSPPRFRPPLRRGATVHAIVPDRCASPMPFRPIPRRASNFQKEDPGGLPFTAAFPTDSLQNGFGFPNSRSTRLPFPTSLPTAPPKRCDRPRDSSGQMRFTNALPTDSQEGLELPCCGCWRCPFPLLVRPVPRRGATVRAAGVGRMPFATAFGPIPLQRRCRRRKRLVCPTLGAVARTKRASSPSRSPCSSLRTPPTSPRQCGACASHQFDSVSGSVWVAKDPHRASKATGCNGLLLPSAPLAQSRRSDTSAETNGEEPGSSSEELAPNRSAHGHATHSHDQTLDPTARVIDVAADSDPARSLGGDHLRESVQYGTRRDAWSVVPRRSTRHGAADPLLTAPSEDGTAWRNPTDREIRPHFEARWLLTLPSCSKVLPPSSCLCCVSLANPPDTWNRMQRRRPESHLCRRNSECRADAQRPPCGDLPTPELARSTPHRHPTELIARG
jgi:hypothetical protein